MVRVVDEGPYLLLTSTSWVGSVFTVVSWFRVNGVRCLVFLCVSGRLRVVAATIMGRFVFVGFISLYFGPVSCFINGIVCVGMVHVGDYSIVSHSFTGIECYSLQCFPYLRGFSGNLFCTFRYYLTSFVIFDVRGLLRWLGAYQWGSS